MWVHLRDMYLKPVCLEGRYPGRMKALELCPLVAPIKSKQWSIACLAERPYQVCVLCKPQDSLVVEVPKTWHNLYTSKHSPQEIGHELLTGWSCIRSQPPSELHYTTMGCWRKVLFLGWRQYPPLVPDFKSKQQGWKVYYVKEWGTKILINY